MIVARMSAAISGTTLRSASGSPDHFRPLPKTLSIVAGIASPIVWQRPLLHVAMKRRVRPIAYALHMTVLDRVEMNVLNVPREVTFIADSVFPESPLPKGQLTIGATIQFN